MKKTVNLGVTDVNAKTLSYKIEKFRNIRTLGVKVCEDKL